MRQGWVRWWAGCHCGHLSCWGHWKLPGTCFRIISAEDGYAGAFVHSSYLPVLEGCPWKCSATNSTALAKAHLQIGGAGIRVRRLSAGWDCPCVTAVEPCWSGHMGWGIDSLCSCRCQRTGKDEGITVNSNWSSNQRARLSVFVLLVVRYLENWLLCFRFFVIGE